MRVLLTGSSGQIGTNLALRLQQDGHWVFGVDKRTNTWTDAFHVPAPGPRRPLPGLPGGVGGVEYPEVDVVVHIAAHAKVHQLVRQPHRALENAIMTFNVLEYCRQLRLPLVFSSTREVYGDVHRFEEYGEEAADFAFTESPYSASKITREAFIYCVRALLRAAVPRLPLLERLRALRQRPPADGARAAAVHAPDDAAASRSPSSAAPTRCSTSPTSTTASTGSRAGSSALVERPRHERDDQPRLRRGEHARPRRRADRGRARRRAADDDRAVARRRGDALRGRHPQGARPARLGAADAARRGDPAGGRLVPEHRAATPRRTGRSRARVPARGGRHCAPIPRPSAPGSVLAIFGPTASGKTDVADGDRGADSAELVSADSMQVYRGLPILTNQAPAHGSSGIGRSITRARSANISGSRTRRSTRSPRRGGRRSSSAAPGSGSRPR